MTLVKRVSFLFICVNLAFTYLQKRSRDVSANLNVSD